MCWKFWVYSILRAIFYRSPPNSHHEKSSTSINWLLRMKKLLVRVVNFIVIPLHPLSQIQLILKSSQIRELRKCSNSGDELEGFEVFAASTFWWQHYWIVALHFYEVGNVRRQCNRSATASGVIWPETIPISNRIASSLLKLLEEQLEFQAVMVLSLALLLTEMD